MPYIRRGKKERLIWEPQNKLTERRHRKAKECNWGKNPKRRICLSELKANWVVLSRGMIMRRWFLMTVQIDEIYLRAREKNCFAELLVFFSCFFCYFKKKDYLPSYFQRIVANWLSYHSRNSPDSKGGGGIGGLLTENNPKQKKTPPPGSGNI